MKQLQWTRLVISSFLIVVAVFSGTLLFVPRQQARASAAAPAYVRMIHASPYIGIADIFVDGAKLLGSFEFGTVTNYVPIPVGAHKVQISAVGKGLGASVLTQNITIVAGKVYTVAALGVSPQALSLQAFIDDNRVENGMAKVRIYHLSPNYGQATIAVGTDATVKDVQYQEASSYVQVPSGPCTFKASSAQETISLPTSLAANNVTSIFVIGTVKEMPELRLVSAESAGIKVAEQQAVKSQEVNVQPEGMSPFLVWLLANLFLIIFTCTCLVINTSLLRRIHYS